MKIFYWSPFLSNIATVDAVLKSIKIAKPKDNILLSPACSSFDQFKSYEERGNFFKKIIMSNYDKN